ncbi:pentatricopeptide repeat-containing protein 2, mitochondrial [Protopterus annectens]|uniref:pentatricopeptide repeat-containing protein 2, mitochondrial n=1 Tax=Protopterus annectens TaxID=7888 RepID=UPI001CFA8D5C|nr:pentatricopeptide repeat-containing protein 2, mitochondrial [Protopterus annectens]
MALVVARNCSRSLTESMNYSRYRGLAKRPSCPTCIIHSKRYLLSEDIIRLREFQQRKAAVAYQIYGTKDQYLKTVNEKVSRNELILKEDLKNLLHLCQTPDDMEIAKRVIYRYHTENKNVAYGEFKFGPLFVRLCYELGLEELAAALIKDQPLRGFFSDSTSFNITMDMLFVKGQYNSALEIFLEMKNQGVKLSKDTYILVTAVCYKLNTPECQRICSALLDEMQTKGDALPRRAYLFAVALALKQGEITKALSVYSRIINTDGKICHNVYILLLAMSEKLEDLMEVLETSVEANTSQFVKKPEICKDVLSVVEKKLEAHPLLQKKFEAVYNNLNAAGQIAAVTLDDLLCRTPYSKKHSYLLPPQRKLSRRTYKPLHSTLMTE